MKRIIAIALLLYALCNASFADIITTLDAPQDNTQARWDVRDRLELKPTHAAYWNIIQTRLWPLKLDGVAKIFGSKLDKKPDDIVLPLFAGNEIFLSGKFMVITNAKNHADFHAVGDIGYVECFYDIDGMRLEQAVFYMRPDDQFVPLKSTNDLSKRMEWEKAEFVTLNKWLDEHMPSKDLGVVEVSISSPGRFELGTGAACIIKTQLVPTRVVGKPTVTNSCLFTIYLATETTNAGERLQLTQDRKIQTTGSFQDWPVIRTNQPIAFSIDDKLYRLTPKLVEQLHGSSN
jgi:hypothetical protein